MNPRIYFSEMWDKLNGAEFTTIRSWNEGKEEYYRAQTSKQFTVLFKEKPWEMKNGTLITYAYLRTVEVKDPRMLDTSMLKEDTTLKGTVQTDWIIKILKMKKVLLLTFTKSDEGMQTRLEGSA